MIKQPNSYFMYALEEAVNKLLKFECDKLEERYISYPINTDKGIIHTRLNYLTPEVLVEYYCNKNQEDVITSSFLKKYRARKYIQNLNNNKYTLIELLSYYIYTFNNNLKDTSFFLEIKEGNVMSYTVRLDLRSKYLTNIHYSIYDGTDRDVQSYAKTSRVITTYNNVTLPKFKLKGETNE